VTTATIETDLGAIEVELFDQSAPKATANFIKLANQGFYDDVVFHRVIPGFVAQAGDGQYGNGSQFFICHQDLTGRLPKNYTLFGQVTRGMDVVDKIVTAPRNGRDLPNEPVAMTSVTINGEG